MTKLITDAFSCRKASHIKIDEKVTQARWSNKPKNDNRGEYHVDVYRLIKMFTITFLLRWEQKSFNVFLWALIVHL